MFQFNLTLVPSNSVACSWASLLKQYIQQAILSFYQTKITWIPALILHLKHVKMLIRVTALAFDPCVLCYRSPYTLYSSLCSKKSEKRVAATMCVCKLRTDGHARREWGLAGGGWGEGLTERGGGREGRMKGEGMRCRGQRVNNYQNSACISLIHH